MFSLKEECVSWILTCRCAYSIRLYFSSGNIVLLSYIHILVYMQGVRNLKETDLNPVYVLIKPPSLEVLEKRLRDRKTETEESLKKRLDVAKVELDFGKW